MSYIEKPFVFSFVSAESKVLLELMNTTNLPLKSIEVLTIFLKDEATVGGGPSQAHIRFDGIKSLLPKEKAVLAHRTWINGKPAAPENDQLARLKVIAGRANPYVLDISWEDGEGKTRFQRIALGH
jgi:hypothetical protein